MTTRAAASSDSDATAPIVVVGAAAAGVAVCKSLRARGSRDQIILIGAEECLPYDRPPLSKEVLSGVKSWDDLQLVPASFFDEQQVDLRLGHRATGVDTAARTVHLADGSSVRYKDLVVATGVRARTLSAAVGIDGVHTLRNYDDAVALSKDLAGATSLVVVGAGFIGLEVAASARRLGVEVTVVEPAGSPMPGRVPEYVSDRFQRLHEQHGVRFRFGRTVAEFRRDDARFTGAVLDDGSEIAGDVAVVAIGSTPNVEWLADSGLDITNGVVCDERNRAADNVFAIGDVASVFDPELGGHLRIEHRLTANAHAETVAAALTGTEPPARATPYFWSDQFDAKLQVYGIWSKDAEFELLDSDPDGKWFTGRAGHGEQTSAVMGSSAGGRLVRLRRQYLST
ncbi:NAD(P)/FAD-dependent oxidoreductase [Gordonia alkanivorans]|uniref:NAD(P)/FAD-dependent oxidoreductase n=1 Tax=Gordonia alkanivorans TaxID=84096 RepID=UPI0024481C14|nr:FAD-dependent oxidoreductase [Gordonia alkanivorans]MDH3047136.1 FAD-dependent oxidoreductase [Gordonia alkanivorans]